MPLLHNAFIDDAGRIWVFAIEPPHPDGYVYHVFTFEGRLEGRAILPADFTPRRFHGDVIYGTARGPLHTPVVVRVRLHEVEE